MAEEGRDGSLLAEQIAYYRAVADEYEDHVLPDQGQDELYSALEKFRPTGRVLELACGTGTWTRRLMRHAQIVTALDVSPEMLARAKEQLGRKGVEYVQADLFDWQPAGRFDVVFFSFWISHVPVDRFRDFWTLIGHCLDVDGRVFFCDDHHRTAEELIKGRESSTIRRRLNDGTEFRAIKVPYHAEELERRLQDIGWSISVTATTEGPFYWGAGTPAPDGG